VIHEVLTYIINSSLLKGNKWIRCIKGFATWWRIFEKLLCEVAIDVSREIGGSCMLSKKANYPYKVRSDWLNHFDSPWESEGYEVESLNDQLRLTWNFNWASLGALIIAGQETIKFMRTRASEVIIKWNLAEFTSEYWLVESEYEYKPHGRCLMAV